MLDHRAVSDYVVPPHNWFPSFNLTLTANNRVYAPGAGGKLYFRDNVDSAAGTLQTVVFYGATVYAGTPATFDAAVMVSTPVFHPSSLAYTAAPKLFASNSTSRFCCASYPIR